MAPIALAPAPTPSHLLANRVHQGIDVSHPFPKTAEKIETYRGYDHVHWYVGNAKQAAAFYVTRMGFSRVAYRGLETGSRIVASHVVRNGDVTFVFSSPLHTPDSNHAVLSEDDKILLNEIHEHLKAHGDAVRDVAFEVDDVDAVYEAAVSRGAHSVYAPTTAGDDFGNVRCGQIRTYGDTTHTLIQRHGYKGAFLPGFQAVSEVDKTAKYLPSVDLAVIDHCVGQDESLLSF